MWVAREIGMREDHFRKAIKRDRIQARLVRQIGAVYDAWWDRDPLACGVSANVVARVRAAAAREGWSGPLAWDDDTIDDPAAVPQTDAVPPAVTEGPNVAARWLMGESVVLDAEAHDEVLAYLFEWTTGTKTEIAARLGMTPEAAERKWHRLQQRARKDGRRLWRRVYVPGENPESKSLKRDRMGDAA
jgi:hypothetical protein